MEKIIKWTCFFTSGLVVAAFAFAMYISTLLPDTFLVRSGDGARGRNAVFVQHTFRPA